MKERQGRRKERGRKGEKVAFSLALSLHSVFPLNSFLLFLFPAQFQKVFHYPSPLALAHSLGGPPLCTSPVSSPLCFFPHRLLFRCDQNRGRQPGRNQGEKNEQPKGLPSLSGTCLLYKCAAVERGRRREPKRFEEGRNSLFTPFSAIGPYQGSG